LIPLRDDNPTVLWPLVTVTFILANTGVFLYELTLDPRLLDSLIGRMGMVPATLVENPIHGTAGYWTPISSMFLHGGWMHLLGNMLYLWIFGNNIEDSMGHSRFTVFYLLVGLAAAATHVIFNPTSSVPTVGASGAVSGVLGGYLVLFPHARVKTLVTLGWFITIIHIRAWVLLVVWIGFQFLSQAIQPMDPNAGGVAYGAHIGGFVAGLVLILPFRKYRRRFRSP
jgi:membrane associated rhomboid family serine protease